MKIELIEKEKNQVNEDLSKLREEIKREQINKYDLLRSLNTLMSSLGAMKVKIIETIDKPKDF